MYALYVPARATSLKRQFHKMFCFRFTSSNSITSAPEYCIFIISKKWRNFNPSPRIKNTYKKLIVDVVDTGDKLVIIGIDIG
jgi:hypothetical protein